MRVVLLLLSLILIAVARPTSMSTPDPWATPPLVPKTADPRLFAAWNGHNEEVWALYHSGSGTFTQYYYEAPTGALKQLRYDVTITASADGNLTLALARANHKCGVYHAHFMDASEQILMVTGDNAPQWGGPRPQGFSVMRADELPLDLKILNSSAAQQAEIYRGMQRKHMKFNPPVPLPSPIDPRFSPAC